MRVSLDPTVSVGQTSDPFGTKNKKDFDYPRVVQLPGTRRPLSQTWFSIACEARQSLQRRSTTGNTEHSGIQVWLARHDGMPSRSKSLMLFQSHEQARTVREGLQEETSLETWAVWG